MFHNELISIVNSESEENQISCVLECASTSQELNLIGNIDILEFGKLLSAHDTKVRLFTISHTRSYVGSNRLFTSLTQNKVNSLRVLKVNSLITNQAVSYISSLIL